MNHLTLLIESWENQGKPGKEYPCLNYQKLNSIAMKKYCLSLLCLFIALGFGCNGIWNQPQQKEKIAIGMVTFPGYAPLYLAKEKKLFKDVEVELKRIESIGDIRAAMVSNKIDMYAATYDIFQSIEGIEPPGVGFLAIDESQGGDGVVVSNTIETLADLRGKTVGAEPGFPPFFIMEYLLHKEGMSIHDVNFKDLPSQDAGQAFVAGQLDAAGTYEPFLSISAEKREGSRVLVSSKDTPGLVVDWLFASEELVNQKPEVLQKVAEGWFAAIEYWKNNPDESMEIMAQAFGVDKQEMLDIKSGIAWLDLEYNQSLFVPENENNAYKTFSLVGDILLLNNPQNYQAEANAKLTPSIVKAIKSTQ